MKLRACSRVLFPLCASLVFGVQGAELETNTIAATHQPSGDLLFVILRLIGALFLVVGLLLCGVWFFKRSRFFSLYQGGPAQLKILESRSLGYRNTLFVVGYSQRRFLVAASTAGVNLVSPLPDAAPAEPASALRKSFAEQLSALQEPKA